MKTLLVVWHSRTGGTRQMVDAAVRGAQAEPQTRLKVLAAADAQPDDLIGADGYLFAAPENLAALSGQMKEFFDRCYYPCLERLNGRPYGAMFCAGSDGTNAARQLARICTGWRLKAVAEPLIVNVAAQTAEAILADKRLTADQLKPCEELGAALASGLALGVF